MRLLEDNVRPGFSTVETGAGASTVVFAAAGARHTAISPEAGEHQRVVAYCGEIDVDTHGLSFIAACSDDALPSFSPAGPLDLVFIDGSHSFPHPVIDWHYLARHLRVGGVLVLDDVPIPAVGLLHRALDDDPHWRFETLVDGRAALFTKLSEPPVGEFWRIQAFNRSFPDFSFLPPAARARHSLAHRLARQQARLRRLRRMVGGSDGDGPTTG